MKRSFRLLFRLGLPLFLLSTGISPVSAGSWEVFQTLESDWERKRFLEQQLREGATTLLIGGIRVLDEEGKNKAWICAPEDSVTVNIDSMSKPEFVTNGLDPRCIAESLRLLSEIVEENTDLRFRKIIYEHVLYAGLHEERTDLEIAAFREVMSLLAPGGEFTYKSYAKDAYSSFLDKESSDWYLGVRRYFLERDKNLSLSKLKDFLGLAEEDSLPSFNFSPDLDAEKEEQAFGFYKRLQEFSSQLDCSSPDFSSLSLMEYDEMTEIYPKILELLGEKPRENNLSILFFSYYRVTCQLKRICLEIALINEKSGLEPGGSRRFDLSKKEDLDYWKETNFVNFVRQMESELPLKDVGFYLRRCPSGLFFYEMTGIKK